MTILIKSWFLAFYVAALGVCVVVVVNLCSK